MTFNPFTTLTGKIFAGLWLALLLAFGAQTLRVHWANTKADRLTRENAAIMAAQKQAELDQVAVNQEPARKSGDIARTSYVDAQAYYEQGRRAGAAYVAANRVSRSCTPGDSDLPGTDRPAPVDDGPGADAEMVALSRQDFDTLTGNSLRLAKVQQDSQALIDRGVAVALVPDPGFGAPGS